MKFILGILLVGMLMISGCNLQESGNSLPPEPNAPSRDKNMGGLSYGLESDVANDNQNLQSFGIIPPINPYSFDDPIEFSDSLVAQSNYNFNDDIIYNTGYLYLAGGNEEWIPVKLTSSGSQDLIPKNSNWLRTSADGFLTLYLKEFKGHPESIKYHLNSLGTNPNNAFIFYGCSGSLDSSGKLTWNCHENKWQGFKFTTKVYIEAIKKICLDPYYGGKEGTCWNELDQQCYLDGEMNKVTPGLVCRNTKWVDFIENSFVSEKVKCVFNKSTESEVSGPITYILQEGQTNTYSFNGKDYKVTLITVDSQPKALLKINGETTDTLSEGDTYYLTGDSYLGIKTALSQNFNEGKRAVVFYFGTDDIILTSTDKTKHNTVVSYPTDVLQEAQTKTYAINGKDYEVKLVIIDSDKRVLLTVNKEITDALIERDTYQLSDGAYLGINKVLIQDFAGGRRRVEFSLIGPNKTENCYSEYGSCSSNQKNNGANTCVVNVTGPKGTSIVWKSSCGGYQYTKIDGQNEYAYFDCNKQDLNLTKERVSCNFINSTTNQTCSGYIESRNDFVSCSGTSSCTTPYFSGKVGEIIRWKSACNGYGYPTTVMDGVNEDLNFLCNNVNQSRNITRPINCIFRNSTRLQACAVLINADNQGAQFLEGYNDAYGTITGSIGASFKIDDTCGAEYSGVLDTEEPFITSSDCSNPIKFDDSVTCKFLNTDKEQSCYAIGYPESICISGSQGYCDTGVKDYYGTMVEWNSTCGRKAIQTRVDTKNEVVAFNCSGSNDSDYWSTADIAIIDPINTVSGMDTIKVKNNMRYAMTILWINMSTTGYNMPMNSFNSTPILLAPGETKTLTGTMPAQCYSDRDRWESYVAIKYRDLETGSTYNFRGDGNLLKGTCTNDQIPLMVDLKVNGQDYPQEVPYNSIINVTWTSTGTSCLGYGNWVPIVGGNFWGNVSNILPPSGSLKLYARSTNGDYITPIWLDLECVNNISNISMVSDVVNVPVSPPTLTADIETNGNDNPQEVPYNSTITVTWTSTGTSYCTAYGNFVPIVGGGIWGVDTHYLLPSGSMQLYATHKDGYYSPLEIGIQCANDKGESTTDVVYVPVIPSTTTIMGTDLKVNGQDYPQEVPYNSTINVTWTSTGVSYCAAHGSFVPVIDGRVWGVTTSYLNTSGSMQLYATHINYGYVSPLEIGIQCTNDKGDTTVDMVYVPVSPPLTQYIICKDTDGGYDLYNKGNTNPIKRASNLPSEEWNDVCLKDSSMGAHQLFPPNYWPATDQMNPQNVLVEGVCKDDLNVPGEIAAIECRYGCNDGACNQETTTTIPFETECSSDSDCAEYDPNYGPYTKCTSGYCCGTDYYYMHWSEKSRQCVQCESDTECKSGEACTSGTCIITTTTIPPPKPAKETVKCVFSNSVTKQTCSAMIPSTDNTVSCSGTKSCNVLVEGKDGEQLTWKSSCKGYASTTLDGQNEYADFKCTQVCPSETISCNDKCVIAATDSSNCGGCGIKCSSKSTCVSGTCRMSTKTTVPPDSGTIISPPKGDSGGNLKTGEEDNICETPNCYIVSHKKCYKNGETINNPTNTALNGYSCFFGILEAPLPEEPQR